MALLASPFKPDAPVTTMAGITYRGVFWSFSYPKGMSYWKAALSAAKHIVSTIYWDWRLKHGM